MTIAATFFSPPASGAMIPVQPEQSPAAATGFGAGVNAVLNAAKAQAPAAPEAAGVPLAPSLAAFDLQALGNVQVAGPAGEVAGAFPPSGSLSRPQPGMIEDAPVSRPTEALPGGCRTGPGKVVSRPLPKLPSETRLALGPTAPLPEAQPATAVRTPAVLARPPMQLAGAEPERPAPGPDAEPLPTPTTTGTGTGVVPGSPEAGGPSRQTVAGSDRRTAKFKAPAAPAAMSGDLVAAPAPGSPGTPEPGVQGAASPLPEVRAAAAGTHGESQERATAELNDRVAETVGAANPGLLLAPLPQGSAASSPLTATAANAGEEMAAMRPAKSAEQAGTAEFQAATAPVQTAPFTLDSRTPTAAETPATVPDASNGQSVQPAISAAPPHEAGKVTLPSPAPAQRMPEHEIDARAGHIGHEMGVAIAKRITSGGEELTVRLSPGEFGKIEVRMAFDDGGTLRAVVAAERSEALDLLRRDSADLTRAMTDAGIRTDQQSFRFDARSGNGDAQGFWQRQQQQRQQQGGEFRDGNQPAMTAQEPVYHQLRTAGRINLMA